MALLSILAKHGNGCDHHSWQFLGMARSFSTRGNACHTLCLGLPWEKLRGATLKIAHICEIIYGLYCILGTAGWILFKIGIGDASPQGILLSFFFYFCARSVLCHICTNTAWNKTHICLLRAGWAAQRTTVCLDFDGSQNNSNKVFFHLLNYYFSSFCFRNSEFHSIISALNIIPKCSHLCVQNSW